MKLNGMRMVGKIVAVFVLALVMGAGLAEMSSLAIAENTYQVATADALSNAIQAINESDNGNYAVYLEADIALSNNISLTKNTVTIYGENHTLSLNGCSIDVTAGQLNLGAEDYGKTLSVMASEAQPVDNPLVSVCGTSKLNVYDHVTICGRTNESSVAGVDVYNSAVFHMYGGAISDCHTKSIAGSGVGLHDTAQFIMSDGKIDNCTGASGGVRMDENSTFVMNGGTIENCKQNYYTGDNGKYGQGGGVTVGNNAKFTMNGGKIKGCETNSLGGGGVYIANSSASTTGFEMTAGEITGCKASGYSENSTNSGLGGGVFVYIGTADIKGGAIYNNQANLLGDDVFSYGISGSTQYSSLKLCGVPSGLTLTVTGKAIDGWYADGVVDATDTARWDKDNLANAVKYAPPTTAIATQIGLKAAHGTEWASLQSAINGAESGATIKVSTYAGNDKKITADASESALTVASGKTVTLDLDGCTINRGLTSATANGNVISVYGALTVTDTGSGGTITGGYSKYSDGARGGGVYIAPAGSFTLAGGTISGNRADEENDNGGGVYVDCDSSSYGAFAMTGGAISGNTAKSGGGVYIDSSDISFAMSGNAVISNNTASSEGGGIFGGNVTMSGNVSVTGNTGYRSGVRCSSLAMSDNAAITGNHSTGTDNTSLAVSAYGSISLSGSVRITGNTNPDGQPANVAVTGNTKLAIAGDLGGDARVGVTSWSDVSNASPLVFTSGLSGHGAAANFTSDQGYAVTLTDNGEAQLIGNTVTFYYYGDTTWHVYYNEYQTVAVAAGEKVARPTDPTLDGVSFGGWYTDSACTQEYDFDAVVTGALELYPCWQRALADSDVTFATGTWTYNGAAQEPTVTVTGMTSNVKQSDGSFPTGALTEDTDYTVTYADNVNAGTATITVTGKRFNTGTFTHTFDIGTLAVTVKADDQSLEYGDAVASEPEDVTVTVGALASGDSIGAVTITGDTTALTTSGTAKLEAVIIVDASGNDVTASYAVTGANGALTVAQKEVGLKWSTDTTPLTYNGSPQQPTAEATGLADGDAVTVTVTVEGDHTNAGDSYTATATALVGDNVDKYKLPAAPDNAKTFAIGGAPLTIAVKDQTYGYDGQPHGENNAVYQYPDAEKIDVSGLIGNDKITMIGLSGQAANAGEYEIEITSIVVMSGPEIDNYSVTEVPGKLTIKPKPVTATVTAVDREYIAGNKTVSLTAGSVNAVLDGDTVTVDVSGATGEMADDSAGTDKAVTVAGVKLGGASAGNYALSEQPTGVTVTINKANAVAATVTANNRTYDGTEQPLVTLTDEPTGGTMQYALGENATTAPADNLYTTSIPAKTDAGTYYVWYRVVGDENHVSTEVACVTVTIAEVPLPEPEPEPQPEPQPEPEPEPEPQPGPSVPLLGTLSAGEVDGLTVEWTAVAGATAYEVYLDGALVYTAEGASVQGYTIAGLEAGSLHTVFVRAVKDGAVIDESPVVEAYVNDGSKKTTNPGSLTLKKRSAAIRLNKTTKVSATVKPAIKGWKLTKKGKQLRYFSDDPSVATVTDKGKVKGVGGGECLIYVLTDNGLWDAMSVTVDAGPKKVSIQGKSKALKVGETRDLIAKLTPANAVTGLTWTSSKPDVASVDQNGKVTAHTPGKTQITVLTSNNKTATKWITVAKN